MEPIQKQYVPSQPAPTPTPAPVPAPTPVQPSTPVQPFTAPAPIRPSTPIQQPTPTNTVPPIYTANNGNVVKNTPKKVGPIVAGLVVIIILIVVALYILASRVNQQSTPVDNTTAINDLISTDTTPVVTETPAEIKPVTGTSDDLQSLQADLDTSIEGVDAQSI
ncbi:MAG: hypothetical protein WCS89_02740 [Candidatus Paceibacterota bacterium]|jgi:hypothetical protein